MLRHERLSSKRLTPPSAIAALNADQGVAMLRRALGEEAVRVVGGAVRNALLGHAVKDCDLATSWSPEMVIERLARAGIRTIPTGIAHGTVTAVIDGKPYEITTLRHDVETFGRHARVAFTDDWLADAARRDFTFNAMSLDAQGVVHDPFDGLADLKQGRVRFIGNARARIEEDVLRILRFFRFYAWYGWQQGAEKEEPAPLDGEALEACHAMCQRLATLSRERIGHELRILLSARDPSHAWQAMVRCGVVARVIPESEGGDPFSTLVTCERRWQTPPDPLRRLAACVPSESACPTVAHRLRLSHKERKAMITFVALAQLSLESPHAVHRAFYEYGNDSVIAALPLVDQRGGAIIPSVREILDTWVVPTFPITGKDVHACGVPQSPRLGKLLDAVRMWWVSQDFNPQRAECLAYLQTMVDT